MARWIIAGLALASACARPPVEGHLPVAPRPPKVSAPKALGAEPPPGLPVPDAMLAEQLAPGGNAVEHWVAGPVMDEQREQLVLLARSIALNSDGLGQRGHRTLLVFDWGDGQWRQRLSAEALLPCASCGSFHDQREVKIRLSLSDDRPAHIRLWFDHGWVGGVGITLEYFPDYGFMVRSVSQSGASQGSSRSLPITYSRQSVYPIEGRTFSSSFTSRSAVSMHGETWFGDRPITPQWIAADTADYRRLLDWLSYDPKHQRLPLNPARSLEGY